MRTVTKLRKLKSWIEKNPEFYSQDCGYTCIVGLGLRLTGFGQGKLRDYKFNSPFLRTGLNRSLTSSFALKYGISLDSARYIYCSSYDSIALKKLDIIIEKYKDV